MLGQVFLGRTSTKQGLTCLAQGHKAMMQVSLESTTPLSRVKHSTTELLCSLDILWLFIIMVEIQLEYTK